MTRLTINLQGSLANPNIALEAAKRGDLASIPTGPIGKIDARAIADARKSGVTATCVTVGHVVGPSDPLETTLSELREWTNFLSSSQTQAILVLKVSDLDHCQNEHKVGVIMGFQNTEMFCSDSTAVSKFANMGVRVMQLTYNNKNSVGFGCLSEVDLGLTEFGEQAVEQMNECGVLIDLSHSGPVTLRNAIDVSNKPIAVSHTACRSLVDHPRNVFDEDLRRLSNRGGVVGIFGMPFLRKSGQPHLTDYVRHLEHAISVAGEEHVAIGTDGTITSIDEIETYLHYLREAIEARRAAGVSAPGEDKSVALFLPDLCGPSQFDLLSEALTHRGHPASRIDKIMGLNWRRLLKESWAYQTEEA